MAEDIEYKELPSGGQSMTVKEYAEHCKKTQVAVYRQIQRDKYKKLWENDHIYKNEDGVIMLDDVAVRTLDDSKTSTVIVNDETYKSGYLALVKEKEAWEKKEAGYQDELAKIRKETEERFAKLNEEHARQITELNNSFTSALQLANKNAEDAKLLADKEKSSAEEKTAALSDLQKKLSDTEEALEKEKHKSWWQKLLGK